MDNPGRTSKPASAAAWSVSTGAILILLVVGSVIGTWILAGVVPTMIYYGLSILSPSVFYGAACLICAVVATATGSSWTTAGTIGIALIGIATAQNLHMGLAAGAVISGAYFGDKMSPLSDTTNLAPAVAGTDLFVHIRHMVWTTAPSFAAALVLFLAAGFFTPIPEGTAELDSVLDVLETQFVIGPHLLIPVIVVLGLVIRKVPAFPALLIGALVGGVFAVVFQRTAVLNYMGASELPDWLALVKGVWVAMYGGFELRSGDVALDDLLSRGGMASMLTTVWLIMTAMIFGAVMETTGLLQVIAARILTAVRGTGSLISATLVTSFGMNVLASDQYIAIVLPRSDVSQRIRTPAVGPEEPVANARRRRHPDLGACPVEYLRGVHGTNAWCRHTDLCAVRLLQHPEPICSRGVRLHGRRDSEARRIGDGRGSWSRYRHRLLRGTRPARAEPRSRPQYHALPPRHVPRRFPSHRGPSRLRRPPQRARARPQPIAIG